VLKARIRWVGHVACMGERRVSYRFLVAETSGKERHAKDLSVDFMIILKWNSRKYDCRRGLD
jgi:hypothetical protein